MVPESITAVKPGRTLVNAKQWFFRAHIDRNIGSAKLNRVKRVAGSLLDLDISRDRRDGHDTDVRGTESHDDRDSIVGGNVGVDQKVARHARSILIRA